MPMKPSTLAPDAIQLDPAGVAAVLREARVIHESARSVAADEPRLLHRKGPALENDLGLEAILRRVDDQLQPLERLDHLDGDRPDREVHPLHLQPAAGVQGGLDAVAHHAEAGVGDIEVGIDAEGQGEKVARLPWDSR